MGFDPKTASVALDEGPAAPVWCWTGNRTMIAALCAGTIGFLYFDALAEMVHVWSEDENYGHGFFVPLISLYLIWMKRETLRTLQPRGSWWGVALVATGAVLYGLGELGTVYVLLDLSFWLVLTGLCWVIFGGAILREIRFPLFYLLTMIPLPQFLYQGLSGQLQLLSSALGVGCLQLVGVTAFREGNVIDLGPIQLQVVEACSGLRYLFPLMSLALLCAYLFKAPMWKRVTIFLASMPIAILLNGLRIGIIGVLVEWSGGPAAEGFLHLFEGWVIFLLSLALLLLLIRGLAGIGSAGDPRSFSNLLAVPRRRETVPGTSSPIAATAAWGTPSSMYFAVGLVAILAAGSPFLSSREEAVPPAPPLLSFPMQVEAWRGSPFPLEKEYIDALRFDDYVLADYRAVDGSPVNFYVAYYRSQRKGQSAHSPRTCIPGGGWEITSLRTVDVPSGDAASAPLSVNRVVIQKGGTKQIVYYWFKQRDRLLTDEYLVKLFLFWDALTRQRTDGALIRLAATVPPGQDEGDTDRDLMAFTRSVNPLISRYVPD